MDYRQFLQDGGRELNLPYFAGRKVCDDSRVWRLREDLAPGWYRFKVRGRFVEPIEAVEADLDTWESRGLKKLSGFYALNRFIGDTRQAYLFGLPADEDLPRFSPISVVEWFDGHLHFSAIEFESEAEPAVREAFEEDGSIESIKAVTPALANAFLLESTQRELAREAIRRREEEARLAELAAEARQERRRMARQEQSIEGRIALALSHTGAQLLDWRRSGDNQITVRYRLGRSRFECVIDAESLRILDAGICLEGADSELNLASLPSAVQEAMKTGQLHVFRHG